MPETLAVCVQTQFGEGVSCVGQFCGWDLERAAELTTDGDKYPIWQTAESFEGTAGGEFKFVIKTGCGTVRWEQCENRCHKEVSGLIQCGNFGSHLEDGDENVAPEVVRVEVVSEQKVAPLDPQEKLERDIHKAKPVAAIAKTTKDIVAQDVQPVPVAVKVGTKVRKSSDRVSSDKPVKVASTKAVEPVPTVSGGAPAVSGEATPTVVKRRTIRTKEKSEGKATSKSEVSEKLPLSSKE